MRNPEKDAIEIAAKRQKLMETGFLLFSQRTIDQVSLEEIARKSGVGIATLYRYFGTKLELVIAISVWQWTQYRQQFEQKLDTDRNYKTAAQEYAFFLDFFLEMYRNHKELLRFNQFFNIFIEGTGVPLLGKRRQGRYHKNRYTMDAGLYRYAPPDAGSGHQVCCWACISAAER